MRYSGFCSIPYYHYPTTKVQTLKSRKGHSEYLVFQFCCVVIYINYHRLAFYIKCYMEIAYILLLCFSVKKDQHHKTNTHQYCINTYIYTYINKWKSRFRLHFVKRIFWNRLVEFVFVGYVSCCAARASVAKNINIFSIVLLNASLLKRLCKITHTKKAPLIREW